jgi:hypothetical protein
VFVGISAGKRVTSIEFATYAEARAHQCIQQEKANDPMDPNSTEMRQFAKRTAELAASGQLFNDGAAATPPATSSAPEWPSTTVLLSALAGTAIPDTARYRGLPERIEVPYRIRGRVDHRFYRTLEHVLGYLYEEGFGLWDGVYGLPLFTRGLSGTNPALSVGTWALTLGFRYAPDERSRVSVLQALFAGPELYASPTQREAVVEAFAESGEAGSYGPALDKHHLVRGMLQAGYFEAPLPNRDAEVPSSEPVGRRTWGVWWCRIPSGTSVKGRLTRDSSSGRTEDQSRTN